MRARSSSRRRGLSTVAAALVALALAVGCDDEPDELTCEQDPEVDCCTVFPERPECVEPPTCDEVPDQPRCARACVDEPSLAHCDVLCAQTNPPDFCQVPCEEDRLQARCVPPPSRPTAQVDVYRDSMGIPHLFAETDEDAFWASGYYQAVDRLGQMDIVRREALGRQAEVFGERKVDRDILLRTIGIARLTEAAVDAARVERPDDHALLVAWTQGVNARIAEILAGTAPTPASFTELGYTPEPWSVMDGAAAGKLLLFGSSNQLENDILASVIRDYLEPVWTTVPLVQPLFDSYTVPDVDRPMRAIFAPRLPTAPDHQRVFEPGAAARLARFHEVVGGVSLEGSNNWAVAGRHTASGRSLIAGDPHQGLNVPSRFYGQHFASATGRFNVAGWAFVGAPGIILGHNDRVAWTATLNYPDMMDLWDVTVDEASIRLGGRDYPIRRRVETIAVAGADPRDVEVLEVPGRGVILPDGLAPVPIGRVGTRLLFNWTGFESTDDIGAVVGLNTARSVDEFEAAIDGFEIGAFNWVAADADDILYVSSMRVPMRPSVTPERVPYASLDGRDPETVWTGADVPRAMLPRSRGETQGYVGSANNDPFGFTADGDITNDAYYFGSFYDPGTRAQRVYDELERLIRERSGALTAEDMQVLQMDTRSLFADRLLPIFEAAWARVPTDPALASYRDRPELTALHDLLTAWDRRMQRDQAAPVVFTGLLYFFAKATIEDELSIVFDPVLGASPEYLLKFPILAAEGAWPNSEALFQDGIDATVLEALELTHLWLTNVLMVTDPSAYTWGQLHCTRFGPREGVSAWDTVPCTPTDGGEGTLNVSSANLLSGGSARDAHRSGGGAIFRMVATFDDSGVPQATVNFPPGNVEDPTSVHWDDTLDDWVAGVFSPLPFSRADVEAASTALPPLTP